MNHDYTHCKGVWMNRESLCKNCTDCYRYALHKEVETGKYKSMMISYFITPPGTPLECQCKITI